MNAAAITPPNNRPARAAKASARTSTAARIAAIVDTVVPMRRSPNYLTRTSDAAR
jgi:hypothetical protein